MGTQVDWSALKVTSKFLDSLNIGHMIIGEVALMYYNSRSSLHNSFSIELAIGANKLKKAEAALKGSFLFANLPKAASVKSCYEGVASYPTFQTTWLEPPCTIILLPAPEFFDFSFIGSRVRPVETESRVYISKHMGSLSRTELFSLPFPQLLNLSMSLFACRLDRDDCSAGMAVLQLARGMSMNQLWFNRSTQVLGETSRNRDLVCHSEALKMVERLAEDQEKEHEDAKRHENDRNEGYLEFDDADEDDCQNPMRYIPGCGWYDHL